MEKKEPYLYLADVFSHIKVHLELNSGVYVIITDFLEFTMPGHLFHKTARNQGVIQPFTGPTGQGYDRSPFPIQMTQIKNNFLSPEKYHFLKLTQDASFYTHLQM